MSKAVLISIQPKWCEKIARGEKTIEVRKNRPKLETPFKCYIYCTGSGITAAERDRNIFADMRCKVIGEFVCDGVYAVLAHPSIFAGHPVFYKKAIEDACLTEKEVEKYSGGKDLCGWHISNLVIYDRPFELRHFLTEGDCDCMNCSKCFWFDRGNGYNVEADCNLVYEYLGTEKTLKPLFRPPQSWCYVEEVKKREAADSEAT